MPFGDLESRNSFSLGFHGPLWGIFPIFGPSHVDLRSRANVCGDRCKMAEITPQCTLKRFVHLLVILLHSYGQWMNMTHLQKIGYWTCEPPTKLWALSSPSNMDKPRIIASSHLTTSLFTQLWDYLSSYGCLGFSTPARLWRPQMG